MAVVLRNEGAAQAEDRVERVARTLRALGNRHRLSILCHLLEVGEASAGTLARQLGLASSSLSQHLKRMREAGLVVSRRQARTILYRAAGVEDGLVRELLRAVGGPLDAAAPPAADGRDAQPDSARLAPAIASAGAVQPLPEAAFQPAGEDDVRLLFTLRHASRVPGAIHPGLVRVARAINLYVAAGVPRTRMHCVVMLGGGACELALRDARYRDRHGTANPNLVVLRELHEFGVAIAACGQTLARDGYPLDGLAPGAEVALSSLTTEAGLQRRGYVLMAL